MAGQKIFSVCGMCTVRCPIQVEVTGDKIDFLQGNPNIAGLEGVCAPGAAPGWPSLTTLSGPNIP
jgi:thiosulfate reductase/polysulfide reductase chain A